MVDAAAALGAGGSSPSPWSVVCNQHSEHQVAEPHSRRSCWLSSGRDVEVALRERAAQRRNGVLARTPVDQGIAEGDGEVEVLVEAVPLPNES